jgi:hypothetical protein
MLSHLYKICQARSDDKAKTTTTSELVQESQVESGFLQFGHRPLWVLVA